MSTLAQQQLFEPTGSEVGALAQMHAAKAEKAFSQADIAESRGWEAIAAGLRAEGRKQFEESCALAMLAEFERLGGVRS